MYQSKSALLQSGMTVTSRKFGVEFTQPSMEVELCVSFSSINSSSVVQVSSETCHKSIQTSYFSGTMLDGGSLAFHSSQYVGRHCSSVSHCNGSHHKCFSSLGAQGSAIAAFNPLAAAAQRHALHRQGFSSSVCQVVAGMTHVTKQCHFCPYISWFLVHH